MNNTGTLHLKVKDFTGDQAGNCELLIRVSTGKLSYAIVNTQEKNLKVLFDCALFHSSLQEVFLNLPAKYEYLNAGFSKIKVASETFHFTFVPEEIYSQETLPVLKNFISSSASVRFITNGLDESGIRSIASVENELVAPVLSKYPQAELFSQAEPFIKSVLPLTKNTKTLAVQFNSGTFELLLAIEGRLIYYNIFSAATTDDFNYFLLMVCRQFDLKSHETEILLSGEIEKYSENYRRILKYFNRIAFADGSKLFAHPEAFSLVPAHQFFPLLSLGVCG